MFSVILPVYNGERFLKEAIGSVFAQTYQDWELVIIDDGSTDGTPQLLLQYQDHPKIQVLRQENQGVSAARNAGMKQAKGNYYTFLDADDIWKENHLAVLAEMIGQYPDAGFYGTFSETHLVNGKVLDQCHFFESRPQTVYLEDFFESYAEDKTAKMYTVITTCVSKEAAQKAGGFPVGCKIGEDIAFSFFISAYYPVVLTSRATAVYQKTNSTATKDDSFDPDWIFFEQVKPLLTDPNIPPQKRENIKKVMSWFSMRRCRHYLIQKDRKKALAAYRDIGSGEGFRSDKWITLCLLFLPTALTKKIFHIRWRSKA